MYDRLFGVFKVGDKKTAPGKEYRGLKDGMPVCIIDETDYKMPIDKILSTDMCRIFCIIEFPRRMKELLIDACQVVGERDYDNPLVFDQALYRPRKGLISFDEIATRAGDVTLVEKLRSTSEMGAPINGTEFPEEIIKAALEYSNPPTADVNAISAGTYEFGTGKTYTNLTAAIADMSNQTGDLTLNQTANSIDTAQATWTENLAGYNFTITSASQHNGNPTAGYTIKHNINGIFLELDGEGPGNVKMYGLNMIYTGTGLGYMILQQYTTTAFDWYLHDIIVDQTNSGASNYGRTCVGLSGTGLGEADDRSVHAYMWNLLLHGGSEADRPALDLKANAVTTASRFENITVWGNTGYGVRGNTNTTLFRNIVSCNNGADDFLTVTNVTAYNCASNDSPTWKTGSSNNVTGINSANEFDSTSIISSLCMKVKSGGSCDDRGSAPDITENTVGIRGNTRPH